jgi:hypothetical protein
MGTKVDVSVGRLCVGVSVERGVKVCDAVAEAVRVEIGVKVLDAGTLVDMSVTTGEGTPVGVSLLTLQARFVAIKRMRK